MKILIASDSFKGTLTALEATEAIAMGLLQGLPTTTVVRQPIADGGEGTVDAVLQCNAGSYHELAVKGPLGEPVRSRYALIKNETVAVMEMASASGFTLVAEDERDAMKATTFGTGELIVDALNQGAEEILIGLGGSATCDGGIGCAQALGIRFLDADGMLIRNGAGGADLARIHRIDTTTADPKLRKCQIVALCDVTNPLTGPNGSARVFAPQKGATTQDVATLAQGLEHLAAIVESQLGVDLVAVPYGGAAGGLGAGLLAFANARLVSGAETVFEMVNLERLIGEADAVICGEGCLDATSLEGKALSSLAKMCHRMNRRLFALVGRLNLPDDTWKQLFSDVAELSPQEPSSVNHAANLQQLAQAQSVKWFANVW